MSHLAQSACTSPAGVAGQLQWISASNKVMWCNGSSWNDTTNATGASCSSFSAGSIQHISGDVFYCNNSSVWISMKGASSGVSCVGTPSGTMSYNTGASKMRFCNGTDWYDMTAGAAAPTSLSLSHTANNMGFTVSWTAGSGNGGASGCRLQYYKDNSTWTNLAGSFNCDATAASVSASLPSADGWTNNFNGTGVQIRLQRISDSSVMGTFSQRTTCSAVGTSASSTPSYDEDCNGEWNNAGVIYKGQCNGTYSGSLALGGAYSCIAPASCSGYTTTGFAYVYWNFTSVYIESWYTSGGLCNGAPNFTSTTSWGSAIIYNESGNNPTVDANNRAVNGSCNTITTTFYQKIHGSAGWSNAVCTYNYYQNGYN